MIINPIITTNIGNHFFHCIDKLFSIVLKFDQNSLSEVDQTFHSCQTNREGVEWFESNCILYFD